MPWTGGTIPGRRVSKWRRHKHLQRALLANLMDTLDPIKQFNFFRREFYYQEGYLPEPRNAVESLAQELSDINEHLTTLFMLTVQVDARQVLELGTRDGLSTLALLEGVRATGGKVTSVDISPCPAAAERVRKAGLEQYWTFVQGDDLEVPFSGSVDHLFIDTSHMYEHTLKELARFEPMVVDGGVITLHDPVSSLGVREAVDAYLKGRPHLRGFRYFNNHGLEVVFKRQKR